MKKFMFLAALLGFAVACGGQKVEDQKEEAAAAEVEAVVEETDVVDETVVDETPVVESTSTEAAPAPEKKPLVIKLDDKKELQVDKEGLTVATNDGGALTVKPAAGTAEAKVGTTKLTVKK